MGVKTFLSHLAVNDHVSASTQNQALSALLFLYREVLDQEIGWTDGAVRRGYGSLPRLAHGLGRALSPAKQVFDGVVIMWYDQAATRTGGEV